MTLRTRLSLTIAGIAVILVLPSALAIRYFDRLRDIAAEQRSRHGEAFIAVGQLQTQLAELDRLQRFYFITPDSQAQTRMLAALDAAREQLPRLDQAGYDSLAHEMKRHLDALGIATRRLELLVRSERPDEASDYLTQSVQSLYVPAHETIRTIAAEINARSAANLAEGGRITTAAATTALSALMLCIGVAGLIGLWTTRALTQPIVQLRNAMAVVADGNFTLPANLAYERGDEIGSASRSFRAMTHRLAELDRLKAEFVSIATHELRTPLNVISGYTELISEGIYGEVTPGQQEALEAVRDQSRILAQLVGQLLDISRLEAGGLRLEIKPESPAELLQRVERAFAPLAQRRAVTLSVAADERLPERVPMDLDRLSDQVLGNLLSNALKFTAEGGSVAVSASADAGWLVITVTDTGCGIPADQLPHIFEKFYQVGDEARKKGAGLGLSIAHDVVAAHGGTIEAESEVDEGTTFRVRIPLTGKLAQT